MEDDGRLNFLLKVQPYMGRTMMCEDHAAQEAARRTVPLEELEEKAVIQLAQEGKFEVTNDEFGLARLGQLLLWFKGSFRILELNNCRQLPDTPLSDWSIAAKHLTKEAVLVFLPSNVEQFKVVEHNLISNLELSKIKNERWVDQPECESCTGKSLRIGYATPTAEERKWQADRVELFRCLVCTREVRFPRYNDPRKLLETRRGRCGEWAKCFTLYCRALGYHARLIVDFTDHAWTECYSPLLGRWVHTDPCEGVLDKPLLYEQGWEKKLSYVIAFSHNGISDVTKRYTRQWPEVLLRRTIVSEEVAQEVLMMLNMQLQFNMPESDWDYRAMSEREDVEIETSYQAGTPPENRLLPGRQSGSEEWRVARGETGSSLEPISIKKECPVRLCVDEHVTCIRDAVGSLWSDIVEAENSVQNVVLSLKLLHAFLMKLKCQPFRKRELKLHSQPEGAWLNHASDETTMSMIEALGLSWSLREDGEFWVSVEENPVRTALALPVALELLERLTRDLSSDVTVKWLVYGSRLCRGVACASGEQLLSGISATAFDGLFSTKWEEPNGAKGAWIVYHLSDNILQKILAYELTSANDCPERDPRDWVLEGSSDNGGSWRKIDSQQGQSFNGRFVCKTYEIPLEDQFLCDTFRLQVLSTQNPEQSGRLQIASIDLITSKIKHDD